MTKLILVLAALAALAPARGSLVPQPEGAAWRLCTMPDLGELAGPDPSKQQFVDHSLVRAANGKWQLWACIRGTKVGRLLYRWEGDSLESGPWRPVGIAARAEERFGEKTAPQESIQAPHFVVHAGRYFCFYNSAGIRLMTSTDGVDYQRRAEADGGALLYGDGGRDVMALPLRGVFHAYSTVSTADRRGYIILRTSTDLRTWTPAKIVCQGGRAGDGPISAESPFVVAHDDVYYLFRASSVDGHTYVYRSATPEYFGVDDDSRIVATLPLKAPEIVRHDGGWFITDLADFQGITIRRLDWRPAGATTKTRTENRDHGSRG